MKTSLLALVLFCVGCGGLPLEQELVPSKPTVSGCWQASDFDEAIELDFFGEYAHMYLGGTTRGTWEIYGNQLQLISADVGGLGTLPIVESLTVSEIVLSGRRYVRATCPSDR